MKMPVSVPDPIARRDIVAYLRQESEQRGKRRGVVTSTP
jgi:hypothetical protein